MQSTANERAVADVLASRPDIAESILDIEKSLVLYRQEHSLPNDRRSDLVYTAGSEVVLIELKIGKANSDHVEQISDYIDIYEAEVLPDQFPDQSLKPILMAESIPSQIQKECRQEGVEPVEYNAGNVLDRYQETEYERFSQLMQEGLVTGVSSLYLINGTIQYIHENTTASTQDLINAYASTAKNDSKNKRTRINRYLKIGRQLDLIVQSQSSDSDSVFTLTDRGQEYCKNMGEGEKQWSISAGQADLINELLYSEPYYSPMTTALVTLVDTIFEIAKNSHQVRQEHLIERFPESLGKRDKWGSVEGTIIPNLRWIGNYDEQLGLIQRVGKGKDKEFYIMPRGFRLLASTHIQRGHHMIKSLGFFGGREQLPR